MGQVAMQIKCRTDSAQKEECQHEGQIGNVETRQEPNDSEQLESDQYKKNE
jgi:hypothetical protein